MSGRDVLILNENVAPSGRAEVPQAGDTYEMPRDVNIVGNLTVSGTFPGEDTEWKVETGGSYSAVAGDKIYCPAESVAITVTLPDFASASPRKSVTVWAGAGKKAVYVAPFAGQQFIETYSGELAIDQTILLSDGQSAEFIYGVDGAVPDKVMVKYHDGRASMRALANRVIPFTKSATSLHSVGHGNDWVVVDGPTEIKFGSFSGFPYLNKPEYSTSGSLLVEITTTAVLTLTYTPTNFVELGTRPTSGTKQMRWVYWASDPTGAALEDYMVVEWVDDISGDVTIDNLIMADGVIKMKEQAVADADEAGFGQIWVKNSIPNQLWFTDDTGVDVQLGIVGAGTGDLLANGTIPLTGNWDIGDFEIRNVSQLSIGVAVPVAEFSLVGTAKIKEQAAAAADTAAYGQLWVKSVSPNVLMFTDDTGVDHDLLAVAGGDLLANGSIPLTSNWDVGAFQIRALTFYSDVVTGTAPFTVLSTTKVTNLNADMLDGQSSTAFATSTQGSTADSALQPVMTTKGDLEAFSTVRARLGIGVNGQVLTADSVETLGMKWANVAGSGDLLANGTVPLTANWDIGGFNITNSGNLVDNTSAQTIAGLKTFTDKVKITIDGASYTPDATAALEIADTGRVYQLIRAGANDKAELTLGSLSSPYGGGIMVNNLLATDQVDFWAGCQLSITGSQGTHTQAKANFSDWLGVNKTWQTDGTKFADTAYPLDVTGSAAFTGDIVLPEKIDHTETPAAGKGLIWVKNNTPSSLMYTNDVGTDFDLSALAGGGDLKADGTIPMTANWDMGGFEVTGALRFVADTDIISPEYWSKAPTDNGWAAYYLGDNTSGFMSGLSYGNGTAGEFIKLWAGTTGAHLRLHSNISTTPGDIGLYSTDAALEMHYDDSADMWDMQGNSLVNASAGYNNQTGTTYTIVAADNGKVLTFNNAAAIAVTLPDTLATNFQCTIVQVGAGVPTVTPGTDTINGAGTGVAPSAQWKGMYLSQYSATNWLALI